MIIKKKSIKVIILSILMFGMFCYAISVPDDSAQTVYAAGKCTHSTYVRYDKSFKKQSISGDSVYCYKTRYEYKQKCEKCGHKISALSVDSWTKHKHDYALFGLGKCKECGRKK
ncbi:MAG: hypothetical protein NC124_16820 [Clostridium sp.]|nr:hypothetical protein [Clostridium sp.]